MSIVKFELSSELRDALRIPRDEQEPRLRRELAIRLYEKELLSFGKARELAGLSKWSFHELLAAEGVPRHYDVEDLQDDLDTLGRKRSQARSKTVGTTYAGHCRSADMGKTTRSHR